MPLPAAVKAETLARDFGGQAKLAAILGVERSTVSRWVHGSTPDPAHAARVDALEFVLAEARRPAPRPRAPRRARGRPALGSRRSADPGGAPAAAVPGRHAQARPDPPPGSGAVRARPHRDGLRWWSTLEASWIHVTLFDRAAARLAVAAAPEPLHPAHPIVREAAEALGILVR